MATSAARPRRELGPWLLWWALALLTLVDSGPAAGALHGLGTLRLSLFLLALGLVSRRLIVPLGCQLAGAELAVATLALGAAAAGVVAVALGAIGALSASFVTAAVLAALAGVNARAFSDQSAPRDPAGSTRRGARLAAAAAVALSVALVTNDVYELRFAPPGAAFYDDVSYHLPEVANWLRYRDLRMPRVEAGDKSTTFYPIFGELMSWFAMALPGGHDFFARWSQLPAGLGLLLLVWALTKRAGGSNGGAALAVALALSIPRFLPDAMLSAGNDAWAAFWFCAALLFALRLAPGMRFADALFLGVALGGVVGVKYLGLLWLPVLAAAGLVAGAAKPLRDLSRHQLAFGATAAFGAMIATGGFAYLRNLWTLGNPVFPAPVELFGYVLFPGWSTSGLAAREGHIWTGIGRLGAFLDHPEILGPIWSRLFLPCLLVLPAAAMLVLARKRDPATRVLAALTVVLVLQIAVYALWIPDRRDVRYVFAAPLLAGVVTAALLSRLPPRLRAPLWCAGGAWALAAVLDSRQHWVALAPIFGLAAGAVVLAAPRWRPALGLVALGLVAASLGLTPTVSRYLELHDRGEPAARALAKLSAGAPVAVAYVGGNRPYFYYGTRLQNRVEIVPTQGALASRFYGLGHWDEREPYEGRRPPKWFGNLDALGIDYILVESQGLESRQARWLRRPLARWRLAAEGPGFEIWAPVLSTAEPSKLYTARPPASPPMPRH